MKKINDNNLNTLLCDINNKNNLVEVKVSLNSLILSPKASVQRCKKLYKKWIKDTFNEDV